MTISLQEKKKRIGDAAPRTSIASSARSFIGPTKITPVTVVQTKGTARSAVNSTTSTSAE